MRRKMPAYSSQYKELHCSMLQTHSPTAFNFIGTYSTKEIVLPRFLSPHVVKSLNVGYHLPDPGDEAILRY